VCLIAPLLSAFAGPSDSAKDGAASTAIVSLDLCSDWMLIRLGGQGRVRAFSPLLYRYPAAWVPKGLPRHDGRLETLLPWRQARFVAGEYNALTLRQRLARLGRRVTVMPLPQRLQQLGRYIEGYRGLLGLPSAGAGEGVLQHPGNGRRLLLLGANGIGTGTGTLENDIIEHAGFRNYLEKPGFQRLDLERLITDPPDRILWAVPASRALAYRMAEHPVLRRLLRRQPYFPAADWRWHCPGPWTVGLIDELAAWGTEE